MEQSREYMLDIIQKEISDKTLRFGCKLLRHSHDGFHKEYYILGPGSHSKRWISSKPFGSMDLEFDENMISKSSGDWYEVIGHPVMIGDVLDYIDKSDIQGMRYDRPGGNPSITLYEPMVTSIRKEKRKPLSEQSDECIRYIYSLLPPEVRK